MFLQFPLQSRDILFIMQNHAHLSYSFRNQQQIPGLVPVNKDGGFIKGHIVGFNYTGYLKRH